VSVQSAVATGLGGDTVAAGGNITIMGSGFDSSSVVTVAGATLATSAIAPQQITAFLPTTVSGYVTLTVATSAGQAAIRMMVAPASGAAPEITLSSQMLQFVYILGGSVPAPQTVRITNGGGGTLGWAASTTAPWISAASAANGVTLSINPLGFGVGTYQTTMTVSAVGASNSPQTITVRLVVYLGYSGISNAASGAVGQIAPGEIITFWGSGFGPASGVGFTLDPQGQIPTALAGVTMKIGGFAAPILYVSANQVNAIVPYEVDGQSQVEVEIFVQNAFGAGGISGPRAAASAAPGIFTANGGGTGQILAANQDGTPNGAGNPAPKGSYVTMYFTGGGQTNPAGTTGGVNGTALKQLTQPASVTVGGQPATVTFAGAAPGMVDGVCQLNIQLASDAAAGAAQPVVLTVGGIASPATGTIAVQ
jgi:uncharacterized protein (TIGR03437 family)